jgi:tRNA modification GTPase
MADLVLWVIDGSAAGGSGIGLDTAEVWMIKNKIDLSAPTASIPFDASSYKNESVFSHAISATNGSGVERLMEGLANFAAHFFCGVESAILTRARHRRLLEDTLAALDRAGNSGAQEELVGENLRAAATALGRLTGRVDVEDVLDVIFRDFCIGK